MDDLRRRADLERELGQTARLLDGPLQCFHVVHYKVCLYNYSIKFYLSSMLYIGNLLNFSFNGYRKKAQNSGETARRLFPAEALRHQGRRGQSDGRNASRHQSLAQE